MSEYHCDDSCSWMSPIGCDILTHEEVEIGLDGALRYDPILAYNSYISNLSQKHPRFYGLVKKLKLHPL